MTRKQGATVPSGYIGIAFKRTNATSASARWFVSAGTEISFYMSNGSATNFVSLSDVDYIGFAICPSNNMSSSMTWAAFMNAYNIQIEQGRSKTVYEPYYNGGTATAEMLLKVGDYQDVQEILSGTVTRNVGVKVLDGTENWYIRSTYNQFCTDDTITDRLIGKPGICSHYVYTANAADLGTEDNVMFLGVSSQRINFSRGSFNTLTEFKQFLADQYAAGTPVIVVYPLATSATESVTGQTLALTNGTNVIDIAQASLDNLELEVKVK